MSRFFKFSRPREIKRFRDMNPIPIAIFGLVLTGLVVLAALQFNKLPFISSTAQYKAAFSDAAGLRSGDDVYVAGIKVGKVGSISLDGTQVVVSFSVNKDIRLGDDTGADIKTESLLGKRGLRVRPAGSGQLDDNDVIPVARTTTPYSLPSALGDLTQHIQKINTDSLSKAFNAFADTIQDTPPEVKSALDGVSRLSKSISKRDDALQDLLKKADSVTGVLAQRSDQLNSLVRDGNSLLAQLDSRKQMINQLIVNIGAVSNQLSGFVRDNNQQIGPALQKLNGVTAVLQKNKQNISQAMDGVTKYMYALGESVASGPYFFAYVQNLVNPGPGYYTSDLMKPFLYANQAITGGKPFTLPGMPPPAPAPSQGAHR